MVAVDVTLTRIESIRLSEDVNENSDVTYNVSASLAEAERDGGVVSIKFEFEVDAQPQAARLSLVGSATIRGENDEIENLIATKEKSSVPPIFMKIYQKVYAVLYLLCETLNIPPPTPGLMKTTSVSQVAEVVNAVSQ